MAQLFKVTKNPVPLCCFVLPSTAFFTIRSHPVGHPLGFSCLGMLERGKGTSQTSDLGWIKKQNIEKNGLTCPGLGIGKRMRLGKSVEHLEVLKTGNKAESRGAPLEVCKSLAVMLSPKPMRVPAVTGEGELQGWMDEILKPSEKSVFISVLNGGLLKNFE